MKNKIINCDDSTTPEDNRHVDFTLTDHSIHQGLYVDREQVIYENTKQCYDIFSEVISWE